MWKNNVNTLDFSQKWHFPLPKAAIFGPFDRHN